MFKNQRYKICSETFSEWLKLTTQLRIRAKTHLSDVNADIPQSYKMKISGRISKKPSSETNKSKVRKSRESFRNYCNKNSFVQPKSELKSTYKPKYKK